MDNAEHGTRSDIDTFVERIGIEIEFVFQSDGSFDTVVQELRAAGLSVLDRRNTHAGSSLTQWTLKRDGSVYGGGELVSPILTYGTHETELALALGALVEARCSVDDKCGIHVHVEARNENLSYFDSGQILKVARMAYRNEDAIFRVATTNGAHRGAQYCKPLEPRHTKESFLWDRADRYVGCNITSFYSRGTIEFRYFDSTLDHAQAVAYVDLCIAIMRNARARRLIRIRAYPKNETGRYLGEDELEASNNGLRSILRRGLSTDRVGHVMAYATP